MGKRKKKNVETEQSNHIETKYTYAVTKGKIICATDYKNKVVDNTDIIIKYYCNHIIKGKIIPIDVINTIKEHKSLLCWDNYL